MKKEIVIRARENSICDAHSPIRTFYLRTLRSPRKHSSENNDEILLHRRNILHPKRTTLFFLSLSLHPLDRALEPRKQIIFISKQNACVAISRAFSGLYIGRKTQCPRNFSENISHISVERARIERKDRAFKERKKMTVPRNVFEILCLRKCENLRSTLFRVYCTLTCYTREEEAVCLSNRVTGVKLLGKAHLPWNICLSALQKFV